MSSLNTGLTFRQLTKDDYDEYTRVNKTGTELSDDLSSDEFEQKINEKDEYVHVYIYGLFDIHRKLLCYTDISVYPDGAEFILDVVKTDPEKEHKGYASTMLKQIEHVASNMGYKYVYLKASYNLINFYKKRGYETYATHGTQSDKERKLRKSVKGLLTKPLASSIHSHNHINTPSITKFHVRDLDTRDSTRACLKCGKKEQTRS